ncbi:TenA family protein [Arundinibacter roseus]|uniref:Thiaminase II n=1 Tax=Arundinibacter roseus TaxID=2070510 RepID=A0A4R4KM84_9BACT|nr:TenA family protein [Arundinibacter roseus]TDB68102.1 thiaminase II [Arundinibacter roseus]
MSLFTDLLWQENLSIYHKIENHPFNQELKKGTLPAEKFSFYIYQDSLYLVEFARALAVAATRAAQADQMLQLLDFSRNALLVERVLHEGFLQKMPQPVVREMAPACFAYTHYLRSVCAHEPFEVAVAALLPCFWIYKKNGDAIFSGQTIPNSYQQWIDTYAGEEFAEAVQKAMDLCNQVAAQASESMQQRMKVAYRTSARMEFLFWESAYQLENWKI